MVIFSAFLKHSELIALLAEDTAKAQQKLREFANVDTLTGAVRPHVLEEKLQGAIEQSERESSCVGVVFIDLDRFKPINDTYGHAAGDLILKTVVERAGKLLRSGDTISRIGGDEFVVALPGIQSEAEAEQVAEKLHKALVQPVEFEGQSIDVGLSMGVAVATHGCASGPQLVKAADELMYEAKRSGRNCFFSRKLSADVCAA
nr:GGDEF domain-containing protein [Litorivivens lipolytica]